MPELTGKYCPLLLARSNAQDLTESSLCREEKCAWWFQGKVTSSMCSILKLAKH